MEIVSLLLPAIAAAMCVLATHVPLGREVVRRGIIFIDLAIAQMAAAFLMLAASLEWQFHGVSAQILALSGAMLGGGLLAWLEQRTGRFHEAVIGISFVLAASAGVIFLSGNPESGEHMRELLVGQILWATWDGLIVPALIGVVYLALAVFRPQIYSTKVFYVLFPIAITISVQLVGVFLVFATLVIPALATVTLPRGKGTAMALGIGVLSYATGLLVSWYVDLPTGAVLVWSLALICLPIGVWMARRAKVANA